MLPGVVFRNLQELSGPRLCLLSPPATTRVETHKQCLLIRSESGSYLHRTSPSTSASDHGDEDLPAPFRCYTAEPFGDLRGCGGIAELVEQLGDDCGIGRFGGADHCRLAVVAQASPWPRCRIVSEGTPSTVIYRFQI